jgi:hypothetical protein
MLETIVEALLSMVVTFLLGFVAAFRGDFGPVLLAGARLW